MIVVDVETAGVNPRDSSILSIGALYFEDPTKQFYAECRPWRGSVVYPQALQANGFTEKELNDPRKPTVGEIVGNFFMWSSRFGDMTLAGENPSFDDVFLRESAKLFDLEYPFGRRLVDLHTASYLHHLKRGLIPPNKEKGSSLSADATYKYVGIPTEPKPHNALKGAKWEAEAFSRLIYGRNLLPEFVGYPVPGHLLC